MAAIDRYVDLARAQGMQAAGGLQGAGGSNKAMLALLAGVVVAGGIALVVYSGQAGPDADSGPTGGGGTGLDKMMEKMGGGALGAATKDIKEGAEDFLKASLKNAGDTLKFGAAVASGNPGKAAEVLYEHGKEMVKGVEHFVGTVAHDVNRAFHPHKAAHEDIKKAVKEGTADLAAKENVALGAVAHDVAGWKAGWKPSAADLKAAGEAELAATTAVARGKLGLDKPTQKDVAAAKESMNKSEAQLQQETYERLVKQRRDVFDGNAVKYNHVDNLPQVVIAQIHATYDKAGEGDWYDAAEESKKWNKFRKSVRAFILAEYHKAYPARKGNLPTMVEDKLVSDFINAFVLVYKVKSAPEGDVMEKRARRLVAKQRWLEKLEAAMVVHDNYEAGKKATAAMAAKFHAKFHVPHFHH